MFFYFSFLIPDDLEFREGDCNLNPNVVFNCNFDGADPLCGFENDATQKMNLTRTKRRVANNRPGTGPDFDHTVNRISYFFCY